MRIALDAMGGDHAPGPIVAGAVQAVGADPDLHVVLVGDQAQIEPLLAAAGDVARPPRDFPLHPGHHHGGDAGRGPAQEARQLHQPLLAAPGRAQGRRHRQRRQHRGDGRRRLSSAAASSRTSAGPASPPSCRRCKGPCVLLDVGANVSPKPEHLFQYGVMGSIFAKHILQTRQADHRPDERRLRGSQGPRPRQGNPRPVQRQPAQGPVHRQHRRPRHPQGRRATSSSPTASSATSSSRSAKASSSSS